MRIAFISYEYPPDSCNGGIATYVGQAARILTRRGHSVEVFASTPNQPRTEEVDGILVHWIDELENRLFAIRAGHNFANRHALLPFDVLEGPEFNAEARYAKVLVPEVALVVKMHTPSLLIYKLSRSPTLLGAIGRQFANAKSMLGDLCHRRRIGPWHWDDLQKGYDLDAIESAHASAANLVAPPCESLCEYARGTWGITNDRIRLTPYPYIPSEDFLRQTPRDEGNVVGFFGRLERRKGIENLAKAIPIVCREFPSARFHFVGAVGTHRESGNPYDQWLAHRLGMFKKHLKFVGKVPLDKMAEAYGAVDVCVFPSLWENFPNVCLEAMSSARAIVGSSQGGMVDMLHHGEAGKLVDPLDVHAIASAIMAFLRDNELRKNMGMLARKRILDVYSENTIGALMESVYSDAIQRQKRLLVESEKSANQDLSAC